VPAFILADGFLRVFLFAREGWEFPGVRGVPKQLVDFCGFRADRKNGRVFWNRTLDLIWSIF
jgi:hypothetical protein